MIPRLTLLSLLLLSGAFLVAAPPKPVDPRLVLDLVAQEPAVRTPTAIDVDAQGRIWVLENNTHFRPKNYDAPPTDRVLIMDDFDATGRAQRIAVFAEGFRDGMGMHLLPGEGVIVSTRAETFLLRDPQQTGHAQEHVTLLRLATKDDYPHNGLSGIALDAAGHLFVGLGENHGFAWTLTGSDGAAITGADEGGIFRCDLKGAGLERWAVGLWNPFGLTFDTEGRLFALDNDPGAGSLCRLLHIVYHGDYGYRMRYGRTVDHPFLSWFGELPGTLPPACLVGEAPTGVILYRGTSLPAELRGQLLGCTWNDHEIQRLPLQPQGASFHSQTEPVVRGGDNFRPTGIAAAPDGSLLISDWVDHSYEVHGKGRIWRLHPRTSSGETASSSVPPTGSGGTTGRPPSEAEARMNSLLVSAASARPDSAHAAAAWELLTSNDPFLFHAALEALAHDGDAKSLTQRASDPDPRVRLGVLLAVRRKHTGSDLLPKWLEDSDGRVRRAALQWISEEHLTSLQPQLSAVLAPPLSRATFHAYLAALQMLLVGKPDSNATITQTRELALDPSRPPELRALAVRLLPTEARAIALDQLQLLLQDKSPVIEVAAAQILAARRDAASQAALRTLAVEPGVSAGVRAEALPGLAYSSQLPETQKVLREALASSDAVIRVEALRTFRGHLSEEDFAQALRNSPAVPAEAAELREQLLLQARAVTGLQHFATDPALAAAGASHPFPPAPWPTVLQGKGDPAAGRRIFYHVNGPGCATCHTIEGRGGKVGPDLTRISQLTPEQLLEAIREPSKDIAPAFTQWLLKLKDGREVTGIDAFEDNKEAITLIDAKGGRTLYKVADILTRDPLPVSLMPPGLDAQMTEQEMRDLLAYLREARE